MRGTRKTSCNDLANINPFVNVKLYSIITPYYLYPKSSSYGYYDNAAKFLRVANTMPAKVNLSGDSRQDFEGLKRKIVEMNNQHIMKKRLYIGPHFKVSSVNHTVIGNGNR